MHVRRQGRSTRQKLQTTSHWLALLPRLWHVRTWMWKVPVWSLPAAGGPIGCTKAARLCSSQLCSSTPLSR